jgi:hypothetical protein
MEILETMDKSSIREFFSKNWITHDAMWMYFCKNEFGMDTANRINTAAVRAMSTIEMQRILKILGRGKTPVKSYEELADVFTKAFYLIKPDFMKAEIEFPGENIMTGGFSECFAFEGLKKAGMAEGYQCAVIERIISWLNVLGVKFKIEPDVKGCLMRDTGRCFFKFSFNF